ncbi:MAG: family 43 glycosylhydrolase [Phycisphaeraceae bacterium]|nr:family 43 glycosylhydrolase [Phycisphaeraceae bacterium]
MSTPTSRRHPLLSTTRAGMWWCLALAIVALARTDLASVIQNGSVWYDTAGQPIYNNGGNMIQEGDTFYWVGYDTAPGHTGQINLYASKDLASWNFVKTIIRRTGEFSDIWWAGRPSLIRQPDTGQYVCVFEADGPNWERHKIGFAVADTIDGVYHRANVQYPEPARSAGDISVYQEGDRAYLLATMDDDILGVKYRNRSLAIYELTPDFTAVQAKVYEGFRNVNGEPDWPPREHSSREGSHIIKKDGLYYWFSSGLAGWNSSATKYATAENLAGPWSSLQWLATDPFSMDSFNTQHDFIIPVAGPDGTTYLYVGDRYSQWTGFGTGRNIFLPLAWNDGVPTLVWQNSWSVPIPEPTGVALIVVGAAWLMAGVRWRA